MTVSNFFSSSAASCFFSAGSEAVAIVADFDVVTAAALMTFAISSIAGQLTFEFTTDSVVKLF